MTDYEINVHIENLFANVDEQGYNNSFLEADVDHCKTQDGIHTNNQAWCSLEDSNDNNHVDMVKYNSINKLTYQPLFRWQDWYHIDIEINILLYISNNQL